MMTFADLKWNCEIQGDYSLCYYDEEENRRVYFEESEVDTNYLKVLYIYPELVRTLHLGNDGCPEICFECEMPEELKRKKLELEINRLVEEVEELTENNIIDYLYDVMEQDLHDESSYESIVESLEFHASQYVDFVNENK